MFFVNINFLQAAWFDMTTREGALETYIRQKRSRDCLSTPRDSMKEVFYDQSVIIFNLLQYCLTIYRICVDGLSATDAQLKEAEEHMRRTPLTDESRSVLLDYFELTFHDRRKYIVEDGVDADDVMKRYPLITKCRESVITFETTSANIYIF